MIRNIILGTALMASTAAMAEVRYYSEYKNDFVLRDFDYQDNTMRNNLRFGAQGEIFYVELGPTEWDDTIGASYEVGYKWRPVENWEFKGKAEGYQFDNFEGNVGSKLETEVRYYFN